MSFFFLLSALFLSISTLMNTFCVPCISVQDRHSTKYTHNDSHVICMHDIKRTSIWNVSFFRCLIIVGLRIMDEYISLNAIKRERKRNTPTPNLDDNLLIAFVSFVRSKLFELTEIMIKLFGVSMDRWVDRNEILLTLWLWLEISVQIASKSNYGQKLTSYGTFYYVWLVRLGTIAMI